ncbi:MAG: hypothetical protein AB1546_06650 [bacterium]
MIVSIGDMIPASSYEVYMAAGLWKSTTPMKMMRAAFEAADKERAALVQNGPWTARTDRLERYAVVNTYA